MSRVWHFGWRNTLEAKNALEAKNKHKHHKIVPKIHRKKKDSERNDGTQGGMIRGGHGVNEICSVSNT